MRGSGEHIAADFDSVCSDADADRIYAGVDHGFEVSDRLDTVCYCFFCYIQEQGIIAGEVFLARILIYRTK